MEKLLANNLSFKTFNWLKVNNVEITLPKISKSKYYMSSDRKVEIEEFEKIDFGICKELVELNEKKGNLYRIYETQENEIKELVVNLKQDDKYNILLDTHDIVAKSKSSLKLVLDYTAYGTSSKNRNSVIRILAKEKAKVDLFIIQHEDGNCKSTESIVLEAKEYSNVNIYQFQLGSRELYTNFQGNLRGKEANLNINSIYFGYNDHTIDMLYNIFHYGEKSTSNLVVNGVLKDSSFKSFKSTLDFKQGSSFAIGSESEDVLLLKDKVRSISVPLLLAHEDNVEGNHAASAGKVDGELLFYIMTRGFSKTEAESLIIQSKFSGAIDKVKDKKLRGELWDRVMEIVREKENVR